MSIIEAIVLGVVQGLTEFLPVSSSGHLQIAKALLGVEIEALESKVSRLFKVFPSNPICKE